MTLKDYGFQRPGVAEASAECRCDCVSS